MSVTAGGPTIRDLMKPPVPICLLCGDRIGVYEPCVVVERDGERQTSIAGEPQVERLAALLSHKDCTSDGGKLGTIQFLG